MSKKLFLTSAALVMLLLAPGNAPAATTEREPNDTPQQANLISDRVSGVCHRNDQDWFKLNLPRPGKVTATVTGHPADCKIQVTGLKGSTGLGSGIGTVTFDAPTVEIYLKAFLNPYAAACHESDWCAVQCRKNGPWYLAPDKDGRPSRKVPAMHEGQPVYGPISYTLSVSFGSAPPPPYQTIQPSQPSQLRGELIKNGNLRGPADWTVVEWYKPSNGKGEVSFNADGVRFWSMGGNNRIGILQNVNQDVSNCSQLILKATVKADRQRLTGTGYNGREAPIAVFAKYTDINGVVHDLLSENPNEPRNMFWHGFYFLDPAAPSVATHGTKIVRGNWFDYNIDLMTLNPKPKYIHFVGAEGAGWPERDGRVGHFSLQCR